MTRFRTFLVALQAFAVASMTMAQDDAAKIRESRKLMENDTIVIRVINDPDLVMTERTVAQDGTITYHYLGTLTIKGKTIAEVETMIRDGLEKDYIIKPQVSVDMKSYNRQFASVLGKVGKPGAVEIPVDRAIDVIEAIGLAGDFLPTAKKTEILLIRKSGERLKLNYKELKKTTDPAKRVLVEAEDKIFIEESWF